MPLALLFAAVVPMLKIEVALVLCNKSICWAEVPKVIVPVLVSKNATFATLDLILPEFKFIIVPDPAAPDANVIVVALEAVKAVPLKANEGFCIVAVPEDVVPKVTVVADEATKLVPVTYTSSK